ncbi:MAG: TraX family protein [Clostridia bacterium]
MKLNLFHLKLIAFASLTLFTLSISGLVTNSILIFVFQLLGFLCVPLFAYIISEGYRHTHSINKYLLRVLLLAVLTALPHRYVCVSAENIQDAQLFYSAALTAFFCLGSIVLYDKMNNKYTRIFCIVFTVVISFVIGLEFAPHALIIMYIIHICRDKKFAELAYYLTSYCAVIAVVSLFLLKTSSDISNIREELMRNIALLGCVPALPLIKKYDGTKGPSCKIFSYVYYLLLLGIIVSIKVLGGS